MNSQEAVDPEKQHRTGITVPIVAFRKWCQEVGISDTTGWRWAKAGLIHPINIYGKLYLRGPDIDQFVARAQEGEFAQQPGGVCKKRSSSPQP